MQRADKRRIKRVAAQVDKPATYTVTDDYIEGIRRNARREAAEEVVAKSIILMLAFPLTVLERDGFEPDELRRLALEMVEEYNAFADDERSIQDYAKKIYDYTGLKFEEDRPSTPKLPKDWRLNND